MLWATATTAYSDLFQALDQRSERRQTLKGQEAVLEWCGKNGLLGLLPHGVEWIAIPMGRLAFDTVHVPTPIGWAQRNVPLANLLRSADRPDRPPEAYLKTSPTGEAATHTLDSEHWMQFFDIGRRKKKHYFFAPPASAAFWRHYVEPLELFMAAARSLKQAAENLEKSRSATAEPARRWGERELNLLLTGVGVAVGWDANARSYQQVWTSRSLVGALALQLLEDLTAGRRLLACDVCGKGFVGAGANGRFCSKRCYWTSHKRVTRKKRAGTQGSLAPRDPTRASSSEKRRAP